MSAKVNVELVKLLLYNDMKQESPTDISSLKESADSLIREDASKQLDLSVVIIHYQTPELLKKAVESFNHFYPVIPLFVVDNGSDLDIVNQVQEWIGLQLNTQWIPLPNNIFHGPAMDFAARKIVKSKYVFFLDSDTVTKEGGFLESIVELLESDEKNYAVGMLNRVNKRGFSTKKSTGQIILQTPYMVVNRALYLQFSPFVHHGQPTLQNFREAWLKGFQLVEYPMSDSIDHLWRGTARKTGYGLGWRAKLEYLLNKIGV